MKKRLMIFLLGLAAVNAFSAVSYTLRVRDQQVVGTDFYFKIYLQSTGDNLLYIDDSQILLDFNSGYFISDAITIVAGEGVFLWPYNLSANIDVNDRLNIQMGTPEWTDQTSFDNNAILISQTNPGTYIGKFKISTIDNPGGTPGLEWYYDAIDYMDGTDIYYTYNWSLANFYS